VKGSSVLHMMRVTFRRMYGDTTVGDSMFFQALRYYGQQHAHSYATTEDFKNDLEAFTGEDWDWFFQQWVYTPGYPKFYVYWGQNGDNLTIIVNQIQNPNWGYYTMDYPIRLVVFTDNSPLDTVLSLTGSYSDTFNIQVNGTVSYLVMDPNSDYLDQVYDIVSNAEVAPSYRISFQGNTLRFEASNGGEYDLELYDLRGRKVFAAVFKGNSLSRTVDLPSGVYIYRLQIGDRTIRGKLIK